MKLFVPALSVMAISLAACGGGSNSTSNDSTTVTADTSAAQAPVTDAADNLLSDTEKSEGWTLLFNGQNLDG